MDIVHGKKKGQVSRSIVWFSSQPLGRGNAVDVGAVNNGRRRLIVVKTSPNLADSAWIKIVINTLLNRQNVVRGILNIV